MSLMPKWGPFAISLSFYTSSMVRNWKSEIWAGSMTTYCFCTSRSLALDCLRPRMTKWCFASPKYWWQSDAIRCCQWTLAVLNSWFCLSLSLKLSDYFRKKIKLTSNSQKDDPFETIVNDAAVVAFVSRLDRIDQEPPFVRFRVFDWEAFVVFDSVVVKGQQDSVEHPSDLSRQGPSVQLFKKTFCKLFKVLQIPCNSWRCEHGMSVRLICQ